MGQRVTVNTIVADTITLGGIIISQKKKKSERRVPYLYRFVIDLN